MRLALPLLLATLAVPLAAHGAQAVAAPPPAQPVNFSVPAAADKDVASIDAIIAALY